jgi:carboxyl-terminal processing protease
MTVRIRALLAALIVIAVASCGALYIGYRSGQHAAGDPLSAAQRMLDPVLQVATTGSLGDVLSDSRDGGQLVDITMHQIEEVYYRPVDPQQMLGSERKALLDFLKFKHVGHATIPLGAASGDPAGDTSQGAQTLAYAQEHYGAKLGSAGSSLLTEAALVGLTTMPGDPYTEYLSPREIRSLNEQLDGGNFGGIGVYIYQLKDGRVIVQPIQGLPAANAGMKPGEIVTAVDGKPVAGMPLDSVEQLIRGETGSVVHLMTYLYKTPQTHRTYRIVRQIIHVPTVLAKRENGYEYIRLSDFGQTSASEVRKALLDGKAHGVKGYILDLRDNGGGLVDAAVQISSMFIPSGTIVSTLNRDGDRRDQAALPAENIPGLKPLVVLVNKFTASASEITSGAIQDYRVGTIIGTKTFGKGVVQTIYPMPDQGALKITTERYVTPLGRDIQHRGIMPDVTVPQDAENPGLIDTPADKQLAAAKARLARGSQ